MTQALAETGWGGDLLGTPRCADGMKGDLRDPESVGNPRGRLEDQIAILPTLRAGDDEKGGPNQRGSSGDLMLPSAVTCLPTPTSRDWKDSEIRREPHRPDDTDTLARALTDVPAASLLPTPAVNDMGAAYTPEQWDAWTERMKAEHNNGNGHGASLNIEAQRIDDELTRADVFNGVWDVSERGVPGVDMRASLLPTTTTMDAHASGGNPDTTGTHGTTLTDATVRQPSRWGKYAAAIARWEAITRPAPEPTNVTDGYLKARAKRLARQDKRPVGMRGSLKVRRQLAARFSEWMMGVPLGWITDVPDITRNEALKAAGNGVVPQQAAEALRFLLDMPTGRQIAAAAEPDDLLELLAVGE